MLEQDDPLEFEDAEFRTWRLTFSCGALARLADAGFDIAPLCAKWDDAKFFEVMQDFPAMGRMAYAIVRPTADERGVTLEDFLEALTQHQLWDVRTAIAAFFGAGMLARRTKDRHSREFDGGSLYQRAVMSAMKIN